VGWFQRQCCHVYKWRHSDIIIIQLNSSYSESNLLQNVYFGIFIVWKLTSAFRWHSRAGGTVHQTFNARWSCIPSGFDVCVEQPAIVCQECTITDNVPSRAEDCTFSVVVWQWLGDRDCTAQYNCCLPATTDCRRFCHFVCFCFVYNFVRCPCSVLDMIVSP